jgi:hypothetical protein
MAFLKATKRHHRASTHSYRIKGHCNAVNSLSFGSSQVPEMAQSSWMAKKFIRGMTYQWKAKDLANSLEYFYGVGWLI